MSENLENMNTEMNGTVETVKEESKFVKAVKGFGKKACTFGKKAIKPVLIGTGLVGLGYLIGKTRNAQLAETVVEVAEEVLPVAEAVVETVETVSETL